MGTNSGGTRRGRAREEGRRKVLLVALVGVVALAAAFAIATALRNETCDVQTRLPEDRAIYCALQRGEQPKQCDPETTGLTPEQCEEYLDYFKEHDSK